MNSFDNPRPKPADISLQERRIRRTAGALVASVFVAGAAISGGIALSTKVPEGVKSGKVTGKALDWGGSTEFRNDFEVLGVNLHTSSQVIIDDPDFVLTIENCDRGPTSCEVGELFVNEGTYDEVSVGDVVDFTRDNYVSLDDQGIETR